MKQVTKLKNCWFQSPCSGWLRQPLGPLGAGQVPRPELPGLLVLGRGHGGGEEEQARHPQRAEGRGGGLRRECRPGGGEEVGEEHLEAGQGLQSDRRRQLRGQSRQDSEGSGAVKYQNVP